MAYQVEIVSSPRVLGEGPHWDHERQHLYYVDSLNSTIHRFVPSENKETQCQVDPSAGVSIIIPLKGSQDKFLVTIGRNLTIVTWDGASPQPSGIEVIASVDEGPGTEGNRFNDGKVDPTGRLWVGTMCRLDENNPPIETGNLFSFRKGEELVKHVDKISISNGLAWSEDLKHMYYIDSPTKKIYIFDFDKDAGKISNRRVFFDLDSMKLENALGPDGMTIDTDGNLWVAVFGASIVANIDGRTGKLLRQIQLPSPQITSVAFGGTNMDELYVVSAKFLMTEEGLQKYPNAGCTFRVKGLGVKGFHAQPFPW